jgi:hypothetical protein
MPKFMTIFGARNFFFFFFFNFLSTYVIFTFFFFIILLISKPNQDVRPYEPSTKSQQSKQNLMAD